jgi:hypothetical protein
VAGYLVDGELESVYTRRMRNLVAVFSCIWLLACGGAAVPKAPATAPSDAPPVEPPVASPRLPFATPPAVPAPPAACAELLRHPAQPATCGEGKEGPLVALASALGDATPAEIDAALARLETCAAFPPGLVRALRAEAAPVACGDALVAPLLGPDATGLEPEIRDGLVGLGVAAQLSRLVRGAPAITPPFTKQRFQEFLNGQLAEWIRAQAQAIHALEVEGTKLGAYGKAITAVEGGLADMRFVEVVREVPLPEELAHDQDLSDAYYMALDEALEPRKDRGRDAALTGLLRFAELGVLHDPRVERARALLSRLYSGRRIDRLDGLLLPPLPPFSPATVEERLAARLPSFYSYLVLRRADATQPGLIRALLERGLPPAFQAQLDSRTLGPEVRWLYARAVFSLGQRYWRSADFARSAQIAELGAAPNGPDTDGVRLLVALARALRDGPADAAQMMARGPLLPRGVGDVTALDALANSGSTAAPWAGYDAAFLLEMVPPTEPNPAFWDDLATRFRKAGAGLSDPAHRAAAAEHAQAASDTAKALRAQAAKTPG